MSVLKRRPFATILILIGLGGLVLAACTSSVGNVASSSSTTSRTIDANTTFLQTITTTFDTKTEVCSQVSRDTSSCQSSRTALGLSGNWLSFSCNVIIGCADSSKIAMSTCTGATYVTLTTHALPDYESNYWPTTGTYSFTAYDTTVAGSYSSLYSAFSTPYPNPNHIASRSAIMYVPVTPLQAGSTQTMGMGTVGMAVNGVFIYNSVAGNTDNIFSEGGSFDQCGGHPDGSSSYHYHSEPYTISYSDDNLIGVMMDGFFIYGRNDNSAYSASYDNAALITEPGSVANNYDDNNGDGLSGNNSTLYKYGGHVGKPPIGGSNIFHYHLTEWKGCYDEPSPGSKNPNDGETQDTFNTPSGGSCSDYWVDAWFMTGHGNGGVYHTVPSGLSGQSPSQTLAAARYYYGTPGSCTNCP